MKLISNCNFSYNFNGKQLFPINIKTRQANGEFSIAPAHFVELDYSNINDINLMKKINNLWLPDRKFINYASTICRNFFQTKKEIPSKRFFTIQLDGPFSDEFSRTAAIMETTNPERYPKTYLEINFLQSASSLAQGFRKVKAKGAGEQAIYGATKFAQSQNLDSVRVFSTNDEFYENLGLRRYKSYPDGKYYIIERKDFDNFLKKVEDKYDS